MNRASICTPRPAHAPSPASRRDHGARRSVARRARALLGAAALGLLVGSACGDDAPAGPALDADAGPSCERGTRNCACIGGSGCRDDLLCIAGLCSARMPAEPAEMTPRPRPRPTPPDPGDAEPDAGTVPPAGTPDAGALDASVPPAGDGEATPPDAGDDAG